MKLTLLLALFILLQAFHSTGSYDPSPAAQRTALRITLMLLQRRCYRGGLFSVHKVVLNII